MLRILNIKSKFEILNITKTEIDNCFFIHCISLNDRHLRFNGVNVDIRCKVNIEVSSPPKGLACLVLS